MKECYNCGKQLYNSDKTREHIPAQNMFLGYPCEYKKNIVTVPACYSCNQKYAKTDHEIRDAIGIANEQDEKQNKLTDKSIRSILRKPDKLYRLHIDKGNVEGVLFNYDVFRRTHVKNFKGIFYAEFGHPIPITYSIEVISIGIENQPIENVQVLNKYLESSGDWKVSGHEDIFQYKMKLLSSNKNGTIVDAPSLRESVGIASVMIYHKKIRGIVYATTKSYSSSQGIE